MFNKISIISLICLILGGCASAVDAPRNILGFSRSALVAAKESSSYQVYEASLPAVFGGAVEVLEKAKYYLFTKDEVRGFIAVMEIPGVVNTTEVGVFIAEQANGRGVKVELSSRSTPAKRVVAALLFSGLAEKFKKI